MNLKYMKLFEEFDPFSHLKDRGSTNEIPEEDVDDCVLKFSDKNKKINNPYLSLPAGYTCPFADVCKTQTVPDPNKPGSWKIMSYGDIKCYAANDERQPGPRNKRHNNLELIKAQETKEDIVDLLERSFDYRYGRRLPKYFRIHESGYFFDQMYFDAWLDFAKKHPETVFYAFTKSLIYWVNRMDQIPPNFRLTASKGGKLDHLIDEYNLRYVEIVANVEEAIEKELLIDVDDTLASSDSQEPFAILIHGGQVAGSKYAKDISRNKKIIAKFKK